MRDRPVGDRSSKPYREYKLRLVVPQKQVYSSESLVQYIQFLLIMCSGMEWRPELLERLRWCYKYWNDFPKDLTGLPAIVSRELVPESAT